MSDHFVCPCPDGCNGCEVPDFAIKEIEHQQEVINRVTRMVLELEVENRRIEAALYAVYHHAPINPEYGYQGVDADAMFFIAKKAIANSGVDALETWVSVKDRMPEPGQRVIIFGKRSYQPKGFMRVTLIDGYGAWSGERYPEGHNEVTHWMNVPEPPK